MGLGQKFGGKNRGKHGKEKKKRQPAQDYGDIEMKNESFEEYYKELVLFSRQWSVILFVFVALILSYKIHQYCYFWYSFVEQTLSYKNALHVELEQSFS